MGAQAQPNHRTFTVEEYLTLERNAPYKSEYIDGEIYAMSGGSSRHALIASNLLRELGNALEGGPCEVFTSDLKVAYHPAVQARDDVWMSRRPPLPEPGLFVYPDLTVVCGELEFHDDHRDVVMNPRLVVEVLSPSTEDYDRRKKRARYYEIESLQEILFVSQEAPEIEHHFRRGGDWEQEVIRGLESGLHLPSIGLVLSLARIYRNIRLDR